MISFTSRSAAPAGVTTASTGAALRPRRREASAASNPRPASMESATTTSVRRGVASANTKSTGRPRPPVSASSSISKSGRSADSLRRDSSPTDGRVTPHRSDGATTARTATEVADLHESTRAVVMNPYDLNRPNDLMTTGERPRHDTALSNNHLMTEAHRCRCGVSLPPLRRRCATDSRPPRQRETPQYAYRFMKNAA